MHNLRKKTVQITSSTINGKREVGQGNTTVKHGKYGPSSYTSYMKEIAVNTLKRKKNDKELCWGGSSLKTEIWNFKSFHKHIRTLSKTR